ncbi:MAG: hypothetical protein R3D90_02580 [Paracoccaceae bacterium]
MTKRTQKSTGEMISTLVFAMGGLVLLGAALDPGFGMMERVAMGIGALGGFAAAGRFGIAAILARRR